MGSAPKAPSSKASVFASSRRRTAGQQQVTANFVSGNAGDGLNLFENSSDLVQGNYVGTNSAAGGPLPNGGNGIALGGACDEQVCVPASGNKVSGNVVSGNLLDGIHVEGIGNSQSNVIAGNLVGVDVGGTLAIPNLGNGVFVGSSAVNDVVGGTTLRSGNIVAFNGASGIQVGASASDTGTHSAVESNSLFANAGLGIDLAPARRRPTAPPRRRAQRLRPAP